MPTALSVAFTPTPLATGEKVIVEATKQVSAGISFMPRSEYKKVFIGTAASTSPANILTAWQALYGTPLAGKRIFVRVRVVSSTGLTSQEITSSAVVT